MPRLLLSLSLATLMSSAAAAQTLRVGIPAEPDTLDPMRSNTVASRIVLTAACDKLIDVDAQNHFVPQLAQSWEFGDGGTSVTFHLRPGVHFQDGTLLDAEAVRANIIRSLNGTGSVRRSEISAVAGVDVLDPATVRLRMRVPFAPLLAQLADRAGMMVAPSSMDSPTVGDTPVCAGPFRIVSRRVQDRTVLDRFPGYWNAANIHLDHVVFMPMPDASVRLLNLRAGSLEIADSPAATDITQVTADANLAAAKATGLGYQQIIINVGNGPASQNPLGRDPRVREALDLALDRNAINQVAFEDLNTVGNQPEPPDNPFYVKTFPVQPRNVERARQILTAAGYDRVSFELLVPTISEFQSVAEIIQGMAAAAGFDIRLRVVDLATSLQMSHDGQFQAFLITWSGRLDPDANIYPFLDSSGAINDGHYSNPRVDAALDQARSTNDFAARLAAYTTAANIYMAERPRIWIYHENRRWALRNTVEGFVPMPDGLIRLTGLSLR